MRKIKLRHAKILLEGIPCKIYLLTKIGLLQIQAISPDWLVRVYSNKNKDLYFNCWPDTIVYLKE